jgi:hypothetical protein
MSYITTALKRAQRADDERYLPYREIILARPRGRVRGKKRLILGICLASLVLLASTAFSLIVYFGQENAGSEGGTLIAASTAHRARVDLAGRQPERLAPDGPVQDTDILFQAGLRRQQAENLGRPSAVPEGHRRGPEKPQRPEQPRGDLHVPEKGPGGHRYLHAAHRHEGRLGRPVLQSRLPLQPAGDAPKSLWNLKVALWMNRGLKEWARNDPDLEALRSRPEYQKIVN